MSIVSAFSRLFSIAAATFVSAPNAPAAAPASDAALANLSAAAIAISRLAMYGPTSAVKVWVTSSSDGTTHHLRC